MLILFCWILRWQPWITRLLLPFLLIMAPLITLVLSKYLGKWLLNFTPYIILFINPVVSQQHNSSSICTGDKIYQTRAQQYFSSSKERREPYVEFLNLLCQSQISNVGLIFYPNAWEYPLWGLGYEHCDHFITFKHVNVDNESSVLNTQVFSPQAIIAYTDNNQVNVNGIEYFQVWRKDNLGVLSSHR